MAMLRLMEKSELMKVIQLALWVYFSLIVDVVTIDKTRESFRVLYDVSGRFVLKSIKPEEAKFKLVKVT